MKNRQKLELTWIGKGNQLNPEPRILIEDPEKSYGDKNSENMLIFGDKLLMDFYRAEPLPNAAGLLHGRKVPEFVHVDGIDSIFTRDELRSVVKVATESGAKAVHCLAWEFEMDLRLICHELEAAHGIKIKLIPIPRQIMEKNRISPPPFLEMTVEEVKTLLEKLRRLPSETEWIEFKEAKNNIHFDDLGKYFSALSNEVNLKELDFGWLVLGISDQPPRKTVGTNYF